MNGDPFFASLGRPPTGCGAIIMAGGIFGAVALQAIPDGPPLTRPLAAALALGWLAIAGLILLDAAREGFAAHTGPLVGSFAIGTWVAASAVVGRMAMLAIPDAPLPAQAMFVVGSVVWLWFAPHALRNLRRIAGAPPGATRPTGIILLTTVATQAVALLAFRLFPAIAPVREAAVALLVFGLLCYVAGAALIVRRYVAGPRWQLATDWDNTNCILHGALSISGLTAVVGDVFGVAVLAPFWAAVLAVFVAVEAVELARLAARWRLMGWREAVLVYDVSQWARNFTFGMFYAFTAALGRGLALAGSYPTLAALAGAILAYGQYVVLLLLLAELGLMAGGRTGRRLGRDAKTAA